MKEVFGFLIGRLLVLKSMVSIAAVIIVGVGVGVVVGGVGVGVVGSVGGVGVVGSVGVVGVVGVGVGVVGVGVVGVGDSGVISRRGPPMMVGQFDKAST